MQGGALLPLALAPVLAVLQPAPEAPPGVTSSRTEIDAMAPEAVARRLFGEGAAPMVPLWQSGPSRPATEAPLDLLMFRTAGRSAGFVGLCVANQINVRFEPAGPIEGAATRVRPLRSWSTEVYYLPDDTFPVAPAPVSTADRPTEDANCRSIDSRRTHIFLAPDPDVLARALAALSQARATASAGLSPVPLDCPSTEAGQPRLDEQRCLALIARIELDRVDRVSGCPGLEPWRCVIAEIGFDPGAGESEGTMAEIRIDDGGPGQSPVRITVSRIAPPLMP